MREPPNDIPELLARYEATLIAMAACRVESGGDPRKWNRRTRRPSRSRVRTSQRAQP
jgi:hypothetical protein